MADLLKLTMLLISLSIPLGASDFRAHGMTFSIEEEDLIDYIQSRILSLNEHTLSSIQEKVRGQYKKSFQILPFVLEINSATYETHYFDPTIVTKADIRDNQGKVIIPQGTTYNPLEHIFLSQDLLFFDGDQEEHIEWAKSFGNQTKWILINEPPLKLEKTESRPVFFDQHGVLSKKLSIKTVPSRITQEGIRLKIESIPIRRVTCAS